MELASDPVSGGVGGETGSYPMVAAPGSNTDLQQLMVAGYGHYVDGRGEQIQSNQHCTVDIMWICRTYVDTALHYMPHLHM